MAVAVHLIHLRLQKLVKGIGIHNKVKNANSENFRQGGILCQGLA